MPIETTYYEALGITDYSCNGAHIKKQYKVKAFENHPDKNPGDSDAEARFKDIGQAFEVLNDPQKRELYDQFGEKGLEGGGAGGGPGGMQAEDLFAQFFGGGGGGGSGFGGMFGGGGGGMREQGPKKARTIQHVHKVSLEDIYRGKVSKLALQKSIICSKCEGRGGKEGAVKTCMGCHGAGMKIMTRQLGPMIQRFQTVCPDCTGEGETIREKDKCKQCNGRKTVIERKVLHVHVDRGVQSGTKIDFRGEGDQMPGVEPGDVQFEIEQKPHPRFERRGDDLIYNATIDLLTALAGGAIYIEHLDERWLTVEVLPGECIAQGELKVIRGQGLPSYRHHDFGNLYIQFSVKFPETITGPPGQDGFPTPMSPQQIKALESVLPPRTPQHIPPPDAMTEDYQLEKVDPARENARARMAAQEEEHPGAERVQCASQ